MSFLTMNSIFALRSVFLVALFSLSLVNTGCISTGDVEDAKEESGSEDFSGSSVGVQQNLSVSAFSSTLRPTLLSMNCTTCHGGSVSPQFNAEAGLAHEALFARNLVNLTTPENSRIYTKIASGHNGNGSAQAQRIRTAIAEWNAILNPVVNTPPEEPAAAEEEEEEVQANVPAPAPAPAPVPLPTVDTALTVVKNYCMNCHAAGQFGASAWGNIDSMLDLRAFAYRNDSRIVPGNPAASILLRRMLHGPGDQSMPPFAPLHSRAQYQILSDWIASLDPASAPAPAPQPAPPVVSNSGNDGDAIAIAANDRLRLGDRRLVKSILDDVFGPSVDTVTRDFVLKRLTKFGGTCDPLNSYSYRAGPFFNRCNEPGGAGTSQVVDVDTVDIELDPIPDTFVTREGFRIRACNDILLKDKTALDFVVNRIRGTGGVTTLASNPRMSNQEVITAYQMFYPGRNPSSAITTKLKAVGDLAQTASLTPIGAADKRYESWRYVMLTLCRSPNWQTE